MSEEPKLYSYPTCSKCGANIALGPHRAPCKPEDNMGYEICPLCGKEKDSFDAKKAYDEASEIPISIEEREAIVKKVCTPPDLEAEAYIKENLCIDFVPDIFSAEAVKSAAREAFVAGKALGAKEREKQIGAEILARIGSGIYAEELKRIVFGEGK